MKKSELKQLINEVIQEYSNTPYTAARADYGWSGDAICVSADECQDLEEAATKLAKAAHYTVLTGEGLTELSLALDAYEALVKSQ